ncbi:MAG: hypothetical protein SangKO_094810 [Sandaracinaceae bacterium]
MRLCPQCDLREHDPRRPRCRVCGEPLIEVVDPRVGSVLGSRYRIEGVIGEGGMATVYRARHALMERPYAVKVLRRALASDEKLVERMKREGRNIASLTHPNIVQVYDYGETDDGAPYLVMELLDGQPLRQLMRGRPLYGPLLLDVAIQTMRGLARAHDLGVVHRDLKPENVFVCRDDEGEPRVVIVDFGIARSRDQSRLTQAGQLVGTPQYLAPERVSSREDTPSADLYSFGVVLFEMATGRLPFQSNSATGYVVKHVQEPPPRPRTLNPNLEPELEALILELLAKDPRERPVDAHQVLDRLELMLPPELRRESRPSVPNHDPREHTSTLDGWQIRAELFERLVQEAYPGGAPTKERNALTQMHEALKRMRETRRHGLRAQLALDALETEGREAGLRLGHALHVLGRDLSVARDAARGAGLASDESSRAEARARDVFERAVSSLAVRMAAPPEHPDAPLVDAGHAVQAAVDAWARAAVEAEHARAETERANASVRDLDYQLGTLRQQMRQLERDYAARTAHSRAALEASGREQRHLARRLASLSEQLISPLRHRTDLKPLFVAIEGTGTSDPFPSRASG